jgi:hypothetical protein
VSVKSVKVLLRLYDERVGRTRREKRVANSFGATAHFKSLVLLVRPLERLLDLPAPHLPTLEALRFVSVVLVPRSLVPTGVLDEGLPSCTVHTTSIRRR